MGKAISLYEMTNDLIELSEEVEEITEEQRAEIMQAIKTEIENKSESIIAVIREKENLINSIKSEEKRLAEYRKSEEKKLERLKNYTIECMQMLDSRKIETRLGRMSLAKKPDTLLVVDEDKIPSCYKTIEQVIKIDKAQIKKDLKEKSIKGVEIQAGGNRLAIK